VVDVAGGSGFVSLALAKRGIVSTVVDPRESAGKLPHKFRKAWRKVRSGAQTRHGACGSVTGNHPRIISPPTLPPPIPFQTHRSWFGLIPDGVDVHDRHPGLVREDASHGPAWLSLLSSSPPRLPVCDDSHDLIVGCSALVALHPDEATDAVVDAAVALRKPFCVVPCCVFSRLFPNRRVLDRPCLRGNELGADEDRVLGGGRPVHTRDDLLEYLSEKHPSIRRATLPFVGANAVLWSTF
jgi:hypothetical protein